MTRASVNVHYGDKCAVRNVSLDIGRNQVLAHDRAVGLRQIDLSALLQPHERHHPERAVNGTITLDGQNIYERHRTWRSCARG